MSSFQKPSTSYPMTPDKIVDNLDVKEVIAKVKQRPGLWDPTCLEYWDRETKRKLWQEIVDHTADKMNITNKNELGKIVQKSWKNVKGSYVRDYHRLSKLTCPMKCTHRFPYKHYNQLSFLEPLIKLITEDPVPSEGVDGTAGSSLYKRKNSEETILEPSKKMKEYEDEDKMFLMSLLGPLKNMPQSVRLSVRAEMMQVLQRAHNANLQVTSVPILVYLPFHLPVLSSVDSITPPVEEETQNDPTVVNHPATVDDSIPASHRLFMKEQSHPSTASSFECYSDIELELYPDSV